MSDSSTLCQIAERHGVDLQQVQPLDLQGRVEQLRGCLLRTDVPYPISADRARDYLDCARRGTAFSVGSLSAEQLDLGQYRAEQFYDRYSLEEHLSWACLIADQQRTKSRYACQAYLDGEAMFAIGGMTIPDFYLLNARIYQQTGWQLATVSMIIPAELFFTCHSRRFFPVTTFMRKLEQDYLQEPDIGHDVAGHVATFTIPVVAQVMQNHGIARNLIYQRRDEMLDATSEQQQRQSILNKADELLLYAERIYWFTVEFGLVMQQAELRAFGAGILSSPGETRYSIDSVKPTRLRIDPSRDCDLLRLATTDYLISEYQKTYFVTEHFDLLQSLTPERIVATAKMAARLPHFSWRDVAPGDTLVNLGESSISTNEKYFRLMCNQPADECVTRTAIRNLRILSSGPGNTVDLAGHWRAPLAPVPESVVDWFRREDQQGKFAQQTIRPLSFD